MARLWAPAVLLAIVSCAVGAATPEIDPAAVLEHIKVLASDELKGRGNGSPELDRAGNYIAGEFREAGLRPGPSGDWFQPFELNTGIAIGTSNSLVVRTDALTARFTLGETYLPIAVTSSDQVVRLEGVPVVFAGYGISSPELKYDDYEGLDVKGKAVLIFSHEPQENRSDSRLNGNRPIRETTVYSKALAARTRGAAALLVVSDPSHKVDEVDYRGFIADPDVDDHGIPILRIRRDEMTPLIQPLVELAALIDRDLTPRSRALPGMTVDFVQELAIRRSTVRNVVGVLPGSDAARDDEAIVIGGHYDHVGLGGRFSAAPDQTGAIHNGADDNASGIAALIEIARAAAADRTRFPRSIVFVAFAGEERGLFGSAHYTRQPVIPISDTIAMINLDMIGRARGRVEVGGLANLPMLREDVEAAAKISGLTARPGGPGAGRSDDSSFIDQKVPSLHFFTGFHDDYHRPSDDWQQIDAPGTARVATLALELTARLAARNDRPQFTLR